MDNLSGSLEIKKKNKRSGSHAATQLEASLRKVTGYRLGGSGLDSAGIFRCVRYCIQAGSRAVQLLDSCPGYNAGALPIIFHSGSR